MTREIFWLTLSVILTGLLWLPYIVDRIMVRGFMGAMDNPKPKAKPQSAWAQRLYFAHTNAVDNLVLFAPLVLILDSRNISTDYNGGGLRGLFLGAARPCRRLCRRHPVLRTVIIHGRMAGLRRPGACDLPHRRHRRPDLTLT